MKTLSIDIETYSDEPLQKTGVYRYVESPNFEILLFARDFAFKKKSPILPIIYETKRGIKIQNKNYSFFMYKQSKRTPFRV